MAGIRKKAAKPAAVPTIDVTVKGIGLKELEKFIAFARKSNIQFRENGGNGGDGG